MTRSLRIALLSGCATGGAELTSELSRELRSLGHRPTVFMPDDARRGAHDPVPGDRLGALRHAGAAWAQVADLSEFDLVQVDFPEAIPFAKLLPIPVVATVHHQREPSLLGHYAAYPEVAFVAVSRRQAELAWEVPFRAVIHHGLDVERYQLGKGGRRFVCFGISPEDGPHFAVEAARLTRVPLVLCGHVDPSNEAYFGRELAGYRDRGFTLYEHADHMRKLELLASSRALLAPIQWEEPLGLLMIESMLAGTPVIAYACGAAPEIVEEGVTGFLVHDAKEMSRRMRDVVDLDRKACRTRARSRWSSARMARRYSALYHEVLEHRSAHARPRMVLRRRHEDRGSGTNSSVDQSGVLALSRSSDDVISGRRPTAAVRPRAR